MSSLTLKPGREKSLLRRHPWVFSGALDKIGGNPQSGQTVDVLDSAGNWLARAAYSPQSQIRARVWTFDPAQAVDASFFRARIRAALAARRALSLDASADAYRLIHAESDGLPGLVVDRYADVLVMQSLTAGSEAWKDTLADILMQETGATAIYERSDADVRTLEGLPACTGWLRGSQQTDTFSITENGLRFNVNIAAGHKTGFYLDQRDNRLRLRHMAAGRDVLDCFSFSGGFSVNALAGGAKSVLSVDASAEALSMLRQNAALNGLDDGRLTTLTADVFHQLRAFRDARRTFDLIVLDPPKFAPTAAQAEKAARGYKDINLLACKLLRPGGILFTFSCSGGVDAALFQKIVAGAALDAGVDVQIIATMTQGGDHPVALNFPEGAYLKGLVCLKTAG